MTAEAERVRGLLKDGAVGIFFISLAFFVTLPITDSDFWWHLASGRWMWENHSLIQDDPFMIPYSFPDAALRKDFILTQYWLSQLILDRVFAVGGFWGVILLRAGMVTTMFYLLFRLLQKEGAGKALSIGLVFLSSLVIVKEFGYIADKPQLWTSLFSIGVMGMLGAAREDDRRAHWMLPLLMLFWANMHGGYVIGMAIIALYAAGTALARAGSRRFYVSCLVAVIVCGANPNGYDAAKMVVLSMVDPSYKKYLDAIVETQSIFSHASLAGILRSLPAFTGLTAVVALSLLLSLRFLWKQKRWLLLPALLVSVMAFVSIRYIIFFVLIGSLAAGAGIGYWMRLAPIRRLAGLVPRAESVGAALAIVFTVGCSSQYIAWGSSMTGFQYDKPYDDSFGDAVRFIRQEKLSGKMFNEFNKGGYLTWWLWPEIRVAMDTRNLYKELYEIHRDVSDRPFIPVGEGRTTPVYRYFLDSHGIDLVLVSGCDPVSGVPIFLSYALLQDPSWALVHADANALLFMRQTATHMEFITSHRAPQEAAYFNMIGIAQRASRNPHARMVPGWRLSLAIGFNGIGDREKTMYWLGEYEKLVPFDEFAYNFRAMITAARPGSNPVR